MTGSTSVIHATTSRPFKLDAKMAAVAACFWELRDIEVSMGNRSRAARIFAAICIGIISLPIAYAVGVLALIYGGYAIGALVALLIEFFKGTPFQSSENSVAMLAMTGLALAFLVVCSAALYGIWRIARFLIEKLRT